MLNIIQIILAIAVIVLILLQQRGAEGGILFGTKTEFFLQRRGLEKNIYYLTWFLIALFILVSFLKTIQ